VKHITFGDKSLLVGDEVADALLEYAAVLASEARGDTVEIHAIGSDGDEVTATFLLGPGVTMMAESSHTNLPEPDNAAALEYIRQARQRPPSRSAAPADAWDSLDYDDLYEVDNERSHNARHGQ
jgi:hypothetical protein